jgi:hypothetical protein
MLPSDRKFTEAELALEIELLNAYFEELKHLTDSRNPGEEDSGRQGARPAPRPPFNRAASTSPPNGVAWRPRPMRSASPRTRMIRLALAIDEPARRLPRSGPS